MASLTEAVNEAKGQTVLYMPAGELGDRTPAEAARDKHLTQRLETTLIYWTRQVTNVLNKQDCGDGGQQAGPLVEIEFWRSRSLDLSSIRAQLEDKQVGHSCSQGMETRLSSVLAATAVGYSEHATAVAVQISRTFCFVKGLACMWLYINSSAVCHLRFASFYMRLFSVFRLLIGC
jgi:dynein heavy chain